VSGDTLRLLCSSMGAEKIVQKGETSPAGVTRRRTQVCRKVKFRPSIREMVSKFVNFTNFYRIAIDK